MHSFKTCAPLIVAMACAAALSAEDLSGAAPTRINTADLPNAVQLTEKVISGGQPHGEAGFQELRDIGVKTVISVDGAKPDVELAKKYGLRYVHLPHGYNGIPKDRLFELTAAVEELPGPIYIHCHHGKHRSPAAAAAACVSAGYLTNDEGLAVLDVAGTSNGYRGLFAVVRGARPIDGEAIRAANVEFHETVAIPPLAEAMTLVEHTHDHLKTVAKSGWKASRNHPDIDPPHEALLFRENFTELLRTDEVRRQPEEFQEILRQSETYAKEIEELLAAGSADQEKLNASLDRISAGCVECHQKYRDTPLSENAAGK